MNDKETHPTDLFVGARVRLRRRQREVSQEKLAEHLGLTFQQVQKYERGANRISASKLLAIADYLETPIAFFFEGLDRHSGKTIDPVAPVILEASLAVPAVALIPALYRAQQLALNALIRSMRPGTPLEIEAVEEGRVELEYLGDGFFFGGDLPPWVADLEAKGLLVCNATAFYYGNGVEKERGNVGDYLVRDADGTVGIGFTTRDPAEEGHATSATVM